MIFGIFFMVNKIFIYLIDMYVLNFLEILSICFNFLNLLLFIINNYFKLYNLEK